MLGNGRLEAMCFDGVKRLCHIRGKLRKKVWTILTTKMTIKKVKLVSHWGSNSSMAYRLFIIEILKLAGLDQSIGHCPHRPQGLPGAL